MTRRALISALIGLLGGITWADASPAFAGGGGCSTYHFNGSAGYWTGGAPAPCATTAAAPAATYAAPAASYAPQPTAYALQATYYTPQPTYAPAQYVTYAAPRATWQPVMPRR